MNESSLFSEECPIVRKDAVTTSSRAILLLRFSDIKRYYRSQETSTQYNIINNLSRFIIY